MEKESLLQKFDDLATFGQLSDSEFQHQVLEFYRLFGRNFPWRDTKDSYAVFVSEIMLQQTQTHRVIPKYHAFLALFPSWEALAKAETREVLTAWEGLGYYRRALNLHKASQLVTQYHSGETPKTIEELLSLPGVGAYTAAAVGTFAFNIPIAMIETNIRSVYLHSYFKNQTDVHDKALLIVIKRTLYQGDPRSWYYGLMDLGVALKQKVVGINKKSAHHSVQSKFEGSSRQIRAAVLRFVVRESSGKVRAIVSELGYDKERVETALGELVLEGFLVREKGEYRTKSK